MDRTYPGDEAFTLFRDACRDLGIVANVVNPGPTDTGWMNAQQIDAFSRQTPGGRVSLPEDCANLVRFLCSAEGGWISGQLLYGNGGFW